MTESSPEFLSCMRAVLRHTDPAYGRTVCRVPGACYKARMTKTQRIKSCAARGRGYAMIIGGPRGECESREIAV